MDKKTRHYISCPQETHLRLKDTHGLKVKRQKKITLYKWKGKKAGVAVLISDITDFKTKATIRDKEAQYIMIQGTIQQEDVTLVHIYAWNIGGPKYVKQTLMDIK